MIFHRITRLNLIEFMFISIHSYSNYFICTSGFNWTQFNCLYNEFTTMPNCGFKWCHFLNIFQIKINIKMVTFRIFWSSYLLIVYTRVHRRVKAVAHIFWMVTILRPIDHSKCSNTFFGVAVRVCNIIKNV